MYIKFARKGRIGTAVIVNPSFEPDRAFFAAASQTHPSPFMYVRKLCSESNYNMEY